LGETGFHVVAILRLLSDLRHVLRRKRRTYVGADMMFYYREGDPTAVKAPDVFVVKGVSKAERRTYKLWEEKVVPCVVVEVTSKSTRFEDKVKKRKLYQMLGVREYFLFDPLGEYLDPPFEGYRLAGRAYQRITPIEGGGLRSEELGLVLRAAGKHVAVIDPETGEAVPSVDEAIDHARSAVKEAGAARKRAERASRRAEKESRRADAAEEKLERLRREIERLGGAGQDL
jgi:Uma2 family endonuclease